jgi:predicted patatin/cPLA2 family phospholipase
MRALVISGGASKGAFAGGIAEFLIRDLGRDYSIFCGTSTGSLLVPLMAAGEIDRIKHIYSNVSQKDIFSISPFVIRKGPNGYKTGFHHFNILMQFIRGRKTFGESRALFNLIKATLTPEIFTRIQSSRTEVIVTVANLTNNTIEYKYASDCEYAEFCEWIWISSNMVPFMSLVTKNGCEYGDGGFGNLIPVQEAINIGATELDVIVLNPRHLSQPSRASSNAFHLLMKGFHFMLHQIGHDDINIAMMESRYSGVKINLIHTPRLLIDNSIVFESELMRSWWQEGYEHARQYCSQWA